MAQRYYITAWGGLEPSNSGDVVMHRDYQQLEQQLAQVQAERDHAQEMRKDFELKFVNSVATITQLEQHVQVANDRAHETESRATGMSVELAKLREEVKKLRAYKMEKEGYLEGHW